MENYDDRDRDKCHRKKAMRIYVNRLEYNEVNQYKRLTGCDIDKFYIGEKTTTNKNLVYLKTMLGFYKEGHYKEIGHTNEFDVDTARALTHLDGLNNMASIASKHMGDDKQTKINNFMTKILANDDSKIMISQIGTIPPRIMLLYIIGNNLL